MNDCIKDCRIALRIALRVSFRVSFACDVGFGGFGFHTHTVRGWVNTNLQYGFIELKNRNIYVWVRVGYMLLVKLVFQEERLFSKDV